MSNKAALRSIRLCYGKRLAPTPVIERISVFLLEPVNTSWCLEQICDSNYQKLLQLIPDLTLYEQYALGVTASSQPHKIRVYLDAQLAEVLCDIDRPAVNRVFRDPGNAVAIKQYKWRLNYFLQKWLEFCMKAEYQFQASSPL
ncbi:MAG: DUF1249 domain-containing protein [Methylococcaceae bacterium]|nr:DUF1249 domain-containing protein [Methylococcaceae bacterium]